jgi:geranyl-CoA carboxylase alpha subunit
VEFLLTDSGAFYFLEMNTRLQVEHPVTEAVTGLDLVALQLRIAEGQPLLLAQEDVTMQGHAIEVRLYAEDPAAGYRPQTGTIQVFRPPAGAGVRTDHGLSSPGEVTAFYDPMIAKIIAHGADRDQARRRLGRALRETVLLGLRSNRGLLGRILAHPTFADGGATTAFLEANPVLTEEPATSEEDVLVAAAVLLEGRRGFRSAHAIPMSVVFAIDGERTEVVVSFGRDHLRIAGRAVRLHRSGEGSARVRIDGVERGVYIGPDGWIQHQGRSLQVQPWTHKVAEEEVVAGDGRVRAPMAGRVLSVPVAVGDTVDEDTVVVIIEAMKLETRLRAEKAGVVVAVQVAVADTVSAGQILVVVEGGSE